MKERLQKFLSQAGICSRRQAEDAIIEQRVTINGELALIGQSVDPQADIVRFDGQRVKALEETNRVVLAMNKPRGVLCSNYDPAFDGNTVFDILPKKYASTKLFCVGRLDLNSQGLLIITNDGALANTITHPSASITKVYQVQLSRPFLVSKIPLLLKGIRCEREILKAVKVINLDRDPEETKKLEIHLGQGKNRQIRRMFEAFGIYVKKLKRTKIGKLEVKSIPEAGAKELSQKEIKLLLSPSLKDYSKNNY